MNWFDTWFGSGKHVIPDLPPKKEEVEMIEAQGFFDMFSLFDEETINKVKEIVKSVDPEKIAAVMKMIEPKDDGSITINLDLRIRRND